MFFKSIVPQGRWLLLYRKHIWHRLLVANRWDASRGRRNNFYSSFCGRIRWSWQWSSVFLRCGRPRSTLKYLVNGLSLCDAQSKEDEFLLLGDLSIFAALHPLACHCLKRCDNNQYKLKAVKSYLTSVFWPITSENGRFITISRF